jgi:DNA-binding CsgD family transcriptional regulator
MHEGDFARAMALLEEAEQAARSVDPSAVPNAGLFVGAALCNQGAVARHSNDIGTAMARFSTALPFLRAPGGGRRLGMMLSERGVIEITHASLHEATATLVESVALCWKTRYGETITRAFRGMAAVAAATDQPVTAAHLLGAADALDASTPYADMLAARDHHILTWCLARLHDAFNATELARHRRAGTGLTAEQAVALAREAATPVLGAAHVDEIWQASQAPDPGPVPRLQPTDVHQAPSSADSDGGEFLTDREQEVLALLCQRMTDPEIAAYLYISPRTVNRHVANILAKLDAANRREAAAIAVRTGLI